jgi:hypothetical protein
MAMSFAAVMIGVGGMLVSAVGVQAVNGYAGQEIQESACEDAES